MAARAATAALLCAALQHASAETARASVALELPDPSGGAPLLGRAYGLSFGAVGSAAHDGAAQDDPDPMELARTLELPRQWRESCVLGALLVAISAANLVFCCPTGSQRQAGQELSALSDARDVALEAASPQPAQVSAERVDTYALTGLRGMAALHVAFGHYLTFSNLGYDLIGGASMSFFYLLSGFVMTLGYARTLTSAAEEPKDAFNTKRFLKNRFARLVPTYLLTNGMSLALFLALATGAPADALTLDISVGPLLGGFAMTVCGANMWLYPLNAWISRDELTVQLPSNIVTWTVQTMAFFYFAFPAILPWLRRVRRRALVMQLLFWWQAFTFMGVLLIGMYWVQNGTWAYWSARSWPLSRLPVFVMGCLAAVERMHGTGAVSCFCGCSTRCCAGGEAVGWGRRADLALGFYFALLAASSAAFKLAQGGEAKMLIRCSCEAFVPLLFVNLIISLTRCGEHGWAAKLCRSRPLQFMGEIAMAFYMSHLMILMLFMVLLRGSPQVAGSLWTCSVCMVLSLLFGWLVTRRFEQPCQRWLRG